MRERERQIVFSAHRAMDDVKLVQGEDGHLVLAGAESITIPGSVVARLMNEWKRQKCEASGDNDKRRRNILRLRRQWRRIVVEPPESEASGYENSTGGDQESDRSPPSNRDNAAPVFRPEIDNERRNARAARAGKASRAFLRSTPVPLHRHGGTPRAPTKRRRRAAGTPRVWADPPRERS